MAEINKIKVGETTYDVRDTSVGDTIEAKLGTINKLVNYKEGQNLIIGEEATNIQIGTGENSMTLGTNNKIRIGIEDTHVAVMALDSGYNKVDTVEIKASTIDLPTATKLYFNGIPVSKDGNALIFDDPRTVLSLNSGWTLSNEGLDVSNGTVKASIIKANQLNVDADDGGTRLCVEEGRVLAMWSGYGIDIQSHTPNRGEATIELNAQEITLPTVNKMYFGHIPVTVVGESGNLDGDTEDTVNTQIKISNRRYSDTILIESGVKDGDITGTIGMYLGTYYGEPFMVCKSQDKSVNNGIGIYHEGVSIWGDPIIIGGFQFKGDKNNNKLIISYNGKSAEIQLN